MAAVPLPGTRAAVFAAVCVGVSAAGHAGASGHGVPIAGVLAGFAALWAVGRLVASRERGFATILAWLLWGQLALHVLFQRSQAEQLPPHAHHAPVPTGAGAESADAPMLLAHLGALVVGAWWLRRGERAVFALVRLVRDLLPRLLPRLLHTDAPAVDTAAAPLPPAPVRRARPRLRDVRPVRGPPRLLSTD